jgi:NADH dehydrogenase FAD-containing subunit
LKRAAYLGHDAAPLFEFLEPIRVVLRHQQNATVLLDEVIGIAARQVKTRFGAAQSYDYLVPATGSQTPGSAAQMTAPALGRGTAVEQSAMRRISADR